MLTESSVYNEDLKYICSYIGKELNGKTVLITGVCGMIGGCIADAILTSDYDIKVIGLDINEDRAKIRFADYRNTDSFVFKTQNISEPFELQMNCDYIIHAASNAYPKAFDEDPVGTMLANFDGVRHLLDYARMHKARVLYISSGEIYGQGDGRDFTEDYSGYVDITKPRSCYPSSKRAAETLCASYHKQYGVDVVMVRPSHVYGLTATAADTRAASQFVRDAVAGKNIIMKSKGEQIRSYTYVADCVAAILFVLQYGISGEAYNIAYENSAVSIRQMAEIIAELCDVQVVFELPSEDEQASYNPVTRSVLSGEKLKKLGFIGHYSIQDGLRRTVEYLTVLR